MSAMMTSGDTIVTPPALHVFHVVRGDAAVRSAGQEADSTRWYVRRWLEDVDAVALSLSGTEGVCEDFAGATRVAGTVRPLTIRPLEQPACARMKLALELPGTEPADLNIFDVSGRRVHHRTLAVRNSGAMQIEAGAGAEITPGVYWVQVRQGRRPPATQMVVVAR